MTDAELQNKLDNIESALSSIDNSVSKTGVLMAPISTTPLTQMQSDVSEIVKFLNNGSHIVNNTQQSSPVQNAGNFSNVNFKNNKGISDTFTKILEEVKRIATDVSAIALNNSNLPKDIKKKQEIALRERTNRELEDLFGVRTQTNARRMAAIRNRVVNGTASEKDMREYISNMDKFKNRIGNLNNEKTPGSEAIEKAFNSILGNKGTNAVGKIASAFGKNGASAISGAAGKVAKVLGKAAGPIGMAVSAIVAVAKRAYKAYAELDKEATTYARTIGGGATGQYQFRQRVNAFIGNRATWLNGFNYKEASESLTEYANNLGRDAIRLTNRSLESLIMLKRFGVAAGTAAQFQQFGKSIYETDRLFTRLYGSSSKKGLAFSATSKTMVSNLRMAQQYTFQGGLNGLRRMAEVSTQLRYNMQMVASFADKISTLEGALQTSASLSALGGNFSAYGSNPLAMMYEGLNDIESLNERMISMFSGAARWDKGKGEISIDPYERMRIRAAAQATGLDYGELTTMIMNRGRESVVERQLRQTEFGQGLMNSGQYKEVSTYIKNLAEINEKGEAFISNLNGGIVAVSSLTKENIEQLKIESQNKDKVVNGSLKDVYKNTMNIEETLKNINTYLNTKLDYYLIRRLGRGRWGGDDIKKGAWNKLVDSGDKPWEKLGISKSEYRFRVRTNTEQMDEKYFKEYLESQKSKPRSTYFAPENDGKFANGGIINSGSSFGDRNRIYANAGEMVLTEEQQHNLFNFLKVARPYNAYGNTGNGGKINITSDPLQVDVRTNLNDLGVRFEDYFNTDKFAEDIYKRIEFKIKKGFDRENSPFA